jgi:hypothetical protein
VGSGGNFIEENRSGMEWVRGMEQGEGEGVERVSEAGRKGVNE